MANSQRPTAQDRTLLAYRRFVIVSHLRSGTHLLRTSLESHPAIACQTEVFNSDSPDLPYPLTTPTSDVLARWVYRSFPPEVACVGFVLQAYHPWGLEAFPGIRENPRWADVWDLLSKMADLRVIHLRRDNSLRRHLSHVLARETGAWHAWDPERVERVSHLKQPEDVGEAPPRAPAVRLDPVRLELDFAETERLHDGVLERFAEHAYLSVGYEDLCTDRLSVGRAVQEFLEVPIIALSAAVSRLPQRPLPESIANYGALKRRFAETRWARFFDE